VPPLFRLIQKAGNVDEDEMYHVFNMGIGMAIICSKINVDKLLRAVPGAIRIGQVAEQTGDNRVIFKS
jgi:phosphoribosylformylglycinamidine cyclo-ligase